MLPSPFDPSVNNANFIAWAKEQAAQQNTKAHADILSKWAQEYAANVESRNKRAPLAYPVYSPAPLMAVVDDVGNTVYSQFKDLTPPTIPPEIPDSVNTGLASSSAPPSITVQILYRISILEAKIDQLLKK